LAGVAARASGGLSELISIAALAVKAAAIAVLQQSIKYVIRQSTEEVASVS
jgi:hypothetical protein